MQIPFTQPKPDTQVSAAEHVVAHCPTPPVVSQRYGSQVLLAVARQVPWPLHVDAWVSTPFKQSGRPHVLDRSGNVQAFAFTPSHVAAHALTPAHGWRPPCGSPPAGTVVHLPTFGMTSHAWHWLVHTVSQQKPSTQWAESH
jgi:hypothetical protein